MSKKVLWSAVLLLGSGLCVTNANAYLVSVDQFTITKNGGSFWNDDFNALPSATDYVINGTVGPIAGGKLVLDSSNGPEIFTGVSGNTLLRHRVLKKSSINPPITNGLRSDDTFTVKGVFDLFVPAVPGEFYGITLIDGVGGVPGNDNVQILVRRTLNDNLRIQFRAVDFILDTVTVLEEVDLNPAGGDQISLMLSRTSDTGPISASFSYGTGSVFGPATNFTATKSIFNGEDFTRAQFQAVTPIPVPAAVWLFGSGLLGLMGIARRRKS
ncbi:MAG: VPLPA-CTERM sorting domain-containing protein [Gammaproteobacteria bacterium]|nr:VPLPA-CTERM sorting domain-containing protein [Gammaproteobacteria bacterium]